MATFAVLLMLVALSLGIKSARAAGWFDRKPNWLLRLELGMASRRPAALEELKRRIGTLAGWGRGTWGSAAPNAQPYAVAEPAVRRLLSVAGNPTDFDDGCRDFLFATFYYLRPSARHEAAAALIPLLHADDVAVAVRAAQVLTRADEWRNEGEIDAELRRAALVLIERQGNLARSWDDELGALVETARRAGAVDDAAWSRFARQMWSPQFHARQKIRAGDELPYGIAWTKPRGVPREGGDRFRMCERWESCRVDELELMDKQVEFGVSRCDTDSQRPVVDLYVDSAARELPVGRHRLLAAISFRVTEMDPETGDEGRVLAEWHNQWELPVEVVQPGEDVVRAVAAPGLREAFSRTVKAHGYISKKKLWISGEVGPLPTNIAARGVVEEPATGRRWNAQLLVIRAHGEQFGVVLNGQTSPEGTYPLVGAVVNLLLEPDPQAARQTTDITEFADVPVRIEGLTVKSW
jgi:hypothetical protein